MTNQYGNKKYEKVINELKETLRQTQEEVGDKQ